MTLIQIFDGYNTIGGNKIYLEEKDEGFFLDFGMNFKKYGDFFQEFISPRIPRGIHDLLQLNLIPKLNIYRKDLIPSDTNTSSFPSLNVNAILLSHAHMDHCGNIGLLSTNYPIIASPPTITLLKAMLDCSSSMLGSDVAYYSLKSPHNDKRILKTEKYKEYGRNFICTEPFSKTFQEFLTTTFKSRTKFTEGNLMDLIEFSTNLEIKAYEVDHSIYGATGYIISGDNTIAYTGDFRLHGKIGEKSEEFMKEAKDASILIIEGTRAAREDVSESEEIVYENCLKAAEDVKGLIIADFTARNFERLEIFKLIAEKVDRTLIITPKDAYLLKALEMADNINRIRDLRVYKDLKATTKGWEQILLNSESELSYIDPSEISKNQEKFIICFSFYEIKNLLDINPSKGMYIYSSSEAFEEESEFDFLRLYNWLKYFGFEIVGFEVFEEVNKFRPRFTKGYHASGHASKSDLIKVIDYIDPDIIIPVHTDNPEWFTNSYDKSILLNDRKKYIG
ncbi:MAG: MBL fold metallo-hydrolase RNA specificity domain-containing protein [Candidatus Hermodarchaeota archaeon]